MADPEGNEFDINQTPVPGSGPTEWVSRSNGASFQPRIVHCKACGQGIIGLCTGFGFGLVRSGELEPTPAAMDPDTGV